MTAASALRALLDGPDADIRETVREWLSRPGNAAAVDLPLEQHREQVLA